MWIQVEMTGDDGPLAVKGSVGSAHQRQTKDRRGAFHTLFTDGIGNPGAETLTDVCRGRCPRLEDRWNE